MSNAVATQEAVDQAVADLAASGEDPTYERIKLKIGGGSYSTIQKFLPAALARLRDDAVKVAVLPPEIAQLSADLAGRMAAEIYARVGRSANTRIADIESAGQEQLASANAATAEARREIERLEAELSRSEHALSEVQAAAAQAETRAAIAEGRVAQLEAELARLGESAALARQAEHRALAEAAELRGQISALERMVPRGGESKFSVEANV